MTPTASPPRISKLISDSTGRPGWYANDTFSNVSVRALGIGNWPLTRLLAA
jgi:hypothetical protein